MRVKASFPLGQKDKLLDVLSLNDQGVLEIDCHELIIVFGVNQFQMPC